VGPAVAAGVCFLLRSRPREGREKLSDRWYGEKSDRFRVGLSHFVDFRNELRCPTMNCPRCGLTIGLRAPFLALEHCPRCLARAGAAIPMYLSEQPPAFSVKRPAQRRVAAAAAQNGSPARLASPISGAPESAQPVAADAPVPLGSLPPGVATPLLAAGPSEPRFITDWAR